MDEIEETNNDIEIYKLVFIGRNKKKINVKTFRMPLNFLSAIYNGEISLKQAEISQRKIEKKIEELKFHCRPKNENKEEINRVLMQENGLFQYRDKITDAFKNGMFSSVHLKTSNDAAHDYAQEDVNYFIQEIKSMEKKINLSLFEDFFESSSPTDYVKELLNTSNSDENKQIVEEIEDRISNLKDTIKEISVTEKNIKMLVRH